LIYVEVITLDAGGDEVSPLQAVDCCFVETRLSPISFVMSSSRVSRK
jgi:hypothetical protein